ncbi:MAG: permease [Planctomycetota bacterium]
MMDYVLSGISLRLTETIVNSAVWIVIGCFIAAVFQRMLGPEKVCRIFGNGTRWSLLSGWLMGMLLPVCSLGVIPVVREMHRAGVSRGTIVAFGLTAPLFNPMSILYGLTLSDPLAILSFSLCALAVVTVLGLVWERFVKVEAVEAEVRSMPTYGIKRVLSLFHSVSIDLTGPSLLFILIGIAGSVGLAVSLEKGYLQNQVEHDNVYAPVMVALIATPIYSTPLLAMSQIGGMFQHGNSIGAAFTLLVLGAGANLGLLAWLGATYGIRRVILFYLLLALTSIGLAYAIDKPLYPKGVTPAGHTHAFDVYTHPYNSVQTNKMELARKQATEFWNANEFGGTKILLGLMALGFLFRIVDSSFDFESWYLVEPAAAVSKMDLFIPGWALGVISVVGLIASSVFACYLYYPDSQQMLYDMDIINADCVTAARTEDWEAAEKWIRYIDDLSRRLEVGVFLRNGSVDEFQSAKAKVFREKLDDLKHAVEAKDSTTSKELSFEVDKAYRRMKETFR